MKNIFSNVKATPSYFRLLFAFSFISFLYILGSIGYMYIEQWSFIDSLYMTVLTLTTIGFREVHVLSHGGKIFTILLAVTGIMTYAFTINLIIQTLLENNFSKYWKKIRMKDKISKLSNHIIIAGGGRMAIAIAEQLKPTGLPFVIIEQHSEESLIGKNPSILILEGNALEEENLIKAGIEKARGLASVLPEDADNLFVIFSARQLNPNLYIETRIADENSRSKMLKAGANKVIFPYSLAGVQIARSFINPFIDNFMEIMLDNHDNIALAFKAHEITTDDSNAEKTIAQSNFRSQGFMVVGVQYPNGKVKIAPQANTLLNLGTKVFLIGSNDEVEPI